MGYTFDKNDAIGFVHQLGAETKIFGDEMAFLYCPYCQGGTGAERDKYTFSINLTSGAYNCFRASCNAHGHFVELCRDFDYRLDIGKPTIYRPLRQPEAPLQATDTAIEYMKSRGISPEITRRYEITSHKNNPEVIVFPFYDETGRLQFIKYRNSKFVKGQGAKEWSAKDAMPILFGMKQCVDFKRLIITEGQIDSLSVAQAGFDNAVSVPTGAKGFTWYAVCREWIEKFEEVIVFGDYENGRITLLDELKARLPQTVKAVRIQDYLGEKDANDILRKYGVKAIQKCIENAKVPEIENVKEMSGVAAIDIRKMEHIETGIAEVDKVLNGGLYLGQVVLITGKRGSGKSTLVTQITNNALEQGEAVFIYSGELADYNVKLWMDLQLAGANNLLVEENKYGNMVYSVTPEAQAAINEWYKNRCFLYDNEYVFKHGDNEMETLLQTVERVIKSYSVRLITLDNLMTAMDFVQSRDSLYLEQSRFVGALKKIAMQYQVAVILVAHPRKSNGDFDNDDVSGASEITNKVDVVLNYQRDKEDPNAGRIHVAKNRLFGTLRLGNDAIRVTYSPKSKRIFGAGQSSRMSYGWEALARKKTVEADPVEEPIEHYVPVEDDDELPF